MDFRVRIFWRIFFGGIFWRLLFVGCPINFQGFYTTYFVSGVAHFITNVFHPNDVIDTECVDRRKVLLLVLRVLLKTLLLQNVWTQELLSDRRRCSVNSQYPHIEVNSSCTHGRSQDFSKGGSH